MSFKLTRYGRREVIAATLASVALCAAVALLSIWVSRWFWAGLIPPVAGWGFVMWFFRDPDREIPHEDGAFLSPADGRIAEITRIGRDGPLGRDGVRVGIFMNIFNVHVNRAPCEGRIEAIEHHDGTFMDARNPWAPQRNESATINMTCSRNGAEYPVIVRQIAGLLARRIVTDLSPSQIVRRGERIGMIKFGSRVEILIPCELAGELLARVGQRVKAARTILFTATRSETA